MGSSRRIQNPVGYIARQLHPGRTALPGRQPIRLPRRGRPDNVARTHGEHSTVVPSCSPKALGMQSYRTGFCGPIKLKVWLKRGERDASGSGMARRCGAELRPEQRREHSMTSTRTVFAAAASSEVDVVLDAIPAPDRRHYIIAEGPGGGRWCCGTGE